MVIKLEKKKSKESNPKLIPEVNIGIVGHC